MTEVELHGVRGEVFPDFSETCSYLEAVTYPTITEAVERFRDEGYDADPENLRRVFMRHIEGEEAEEMIARGEVWAEWPDFWQECEEAHQAIPFWKNGEV